MESYQGIFKKGRPDADSKEQKEINTHRDEPSQKVTRPRKVRPFILIQFGISWIRWRENFDELDSAIGAARKSRSIFGSAVRAEH